MACYGGCMFIQLSLLMFLVVGGGEVAARWDPLRRPVDIEVEQDQVGTTWAVLVAGSQGYGNYRHQADVCHAYQILKNGGLKDENIIVFMYDDIAMNPFNPRPGVIINSPQGRDVYAGVPKDYTGDEVTAENLLWVLIGDKRFVKGGSGKVVASKPNDRIFLYYSDHGGPGVLGMPNMPYLYGKDLVEFLKWKHAMGTYKEMVIYVEACESGSLFEGIMPNDLNIYVTTASNAEESSWATYCPGMDPSPPPEYMTCLGDLYSVAWMEDSETHNRQLETLGEQYDKVKERTLNNNTYYGSHVMEYGTKTFKWEMLSLFQGFATTMNLPGKETHFDKRVDVVNQRDADLLFLWQTYKRTDEGSEKKAKIIKEITDTMKHRAHLDSSINMIGMLLFGPNNGSSTLNAVRVPGSPLVDDWQCLKSMVRLFEKECGSLTQYGMKHMRGFANICNNGVSEAAMEAATVAVCGGHASIWSPVEVFSA